MDRPEMALSAPPPPPPAFWRRCRLLALAACVAWRPIERPEMALSAPPPPPPPAFWRRCFALLSPVADAPADTTVTPEGRVTPEGMDTPEGSEMVTAVAEEKRAARPRAKLVFILMVVDWLQR
ncbi:hypothetical protein BT67DRAFT_229340 [Trichocladium antarcticum]|uniref:Uncharacterized protein n=1 Tax=Trichocladium antarcticum TaxID=1450529 RepID=A0AAN6UMW8_9PEZI|nr:hypothetical protein BT67DRAFT_229340 [Trichocladium antarcticum]